MSLHRRVDGRRLRAPPASHAQHEYERERHSDRRDQEYDAVIFAQRVNQETGEKWTDHGGRGRCEIVQPGIGRQLCLRRNVYDHR